MAALLVALPARLLSSDETPDHLSEMITQAWHETKNADQSKQRTDAQIRAGKEWSARLWEYRKKHEGTEGGARATAEALRLLAYTGEQSEMMAKTNLLTLDDPAWGAVLEVLLEAAEANGNYYFLVSRAKRLLTSSTRGRTRMDAQYVLGQAYWNQEIIDKAKEAFRTVATEYAGTPVARMATANINEIESLILGQPAPLFNARQTSGAPIALADLRGKIVLLHFWATWCSACAYEIPVLKQAVAKYKNDGLVIIGVSLDEDRRTAAELLGADQEIIWPQIVDGEDGPLARLFHIRKLPANYVIDRDGAIAAKHVQAASLDPILQRILRKR
jgi:peroxiredoxin